MHFFQNLEIKDIRLEMYIVANYNGNIYVIDAIKLLEIYLQSYQILKVISL